MKVAKKPAAEMERAFHDWPRRREIELRQRQSLYREIPHHARTSENQVLRRMAKVALSIWRERDCSLQRRHQKGLRRKPRPVRSPPKKTWRVSARSCLQMRWPTIFQLHRRGHGRILFIEKTASSISSNMNTRLQVEHPVTEAIFGVEPGCGNKFPRRCRNGSVPYPRRPEDQRDTRSRSGSTR